MLPRMAANSQIQNILLFQLRSTATVKDSQCSDEQPVTSAILASDDLVPNSVFFFLWAGFYGSLSSPTLGVHEMNIGPILFQVATGDITKEVADVIVNSTSNTFNLKSST